MSKAIKNQKQEQKSEFIKKLDEFSDSLPKIITNKKTQGVILLYAEITPSENEKELYKGAIFYKGSRINLTKIMVRSCISDSEFELLNKDAMRITLLNEMINSKKMTN